MEYQRIIVNDDELSGRWAVARSGDQVVAFVARGHATPHVWAEVEAHVRGLMAVA